MSHVPTAKVLAPTPPPTVVARTRLQRRLAEHRHHRLTLVVAGAGYGKSTLLSGWASDVRAAWYTVGPEDAALPAFVRGLVTALRVRIPGLPADLVTTMEGSAGPDADDALRAEAVSRELAEMVDERARGPLVLVLDDVHELGTDTASAQLLEQLCRHWPASMHIVLASRRPPPFGVQRLRGRGEILELDAGDLSFTHDETQSVLAQVLERAIPQELVAGVHGLTAGWPAAVRLAGEALRSVPAEGAPQRLAELHAPGGVLFDYLLEEVVARESVEVRALLQHVAVLERVTPALCEALGVPQPDRLIADLLRRGMFLQGPDEGGWLSMQPLVRDVVIRSIPLAEDERRPTLLDAAAWCEQEGSSVEALRYLAAARAHAEVALLLERRGRDLLVAGGVPDVLDAAADLPTELMRPTVWAVVGEARQVRGDAAGALAAFEAAAGTADTLPAGLAWRIGVIHYLRGEPVAALAAFAKGRLDGEDLADQARLLAWTASAHWIRGDREACREHALRSLEVAERCDDPEAIAAAHTVLAMLAALEGDRRANDAHYLLAESAARRAGNVLQLVRIHTNRGSGNVEEGAYEAAISELDIAIRLAQLTGFAAFHGLARSNRGEALLRLGRLEEAAADFQEARSVLQRIGSRMVSYCLTGLGDVRRERGELALARAAYEEAAQVAEEAGDHQGLLPALAGLARVVAVDDPQAAQAVVERALAAGSGMGEVATLLAAAWVALARGDDNGAATLAQRALAAAGTRRDRAGVAEALELRARSLQDPARARRLLEEATGIWNELSSPIGSARAELAESLLAGDAHSALRAEGARQRLQMLGVRLTGPDAGLPLRSAGAGSVRVRCLGSFQVLRGEEPVPATAWQSKKARDLLKLLIARRGRPTPRDAVMETLWPGEDPDRLGNRLSVLVSTVRSVLDPDHVLPPDHFLATERATLSLRPQALSTDVEQFLDSAARGLEALRNGRSPGARPLLEAAEALYAGDFLEEDVYEDWSTALREEARATYLAVARALAEEADADGNPDASVRYRLRILERDPYDEETHLALVGLLVAAGRHGEAHRRYQSYAARMGEIGVEPAPFPDPSAARSGQDRPAGA